jgi:hypothetical protein
MQGEKSDVQIMLEGVGLFSKAGKVSGVKYPALKLRSQMLSGYAPSIKVDGGRLSGPRARSFLPKSVLDQLVEESREEEAERANQSVEINTGCGSKSRKNRFKLPKASLTPPIGAYNCSFSLVERRIRTANFHLRPKTQRRSELPACPDHLDSPSPPQAHVPSPVSFEKQAARPSILTQSTDVHEGRFVPFNDLSTVISKYHRVASPDIARSKRGNHMRNSGFGPSFNTYRASYSLVQEDLGKGGAQFDKQTSRPSNSLQMHDLEYERSFRLVEKRVTAPNFCKSQKEKRLESPLPAFMCEGVSRLSLNVLMDKGLEMNSFSAEKSSESPQKTVRTSSQFSPSPRRFHRLRTN